MSINELLMSLEVGLIYGIVALGIYFTFRVLDFPDLTCDGSFVLGAASSSMLVQAGFNPWLSLIVTFLSGGLAGFVTGILNTHFKVTDLLAGILMAFMLYSINLHIMNGIPNITLMNINTVFSDFPIWFILCAFAFIVCGGLSYLLKTDFGLALRSIGQNKKLAQNNGVNVKTMILIGLALGNALIALGGALFSQYQGFADVGSGIGTVVVGLASVIIGERLLPYRSIVMQIISCFIGSILYRLFISFALHSEILGLETQDMNLITGLMVIAVMYVPRRRVCLS
jgi:putative tryptophan/tyrosine transport system permease protein